MKKLTKITIFLILFSTFTIIDAQVYKIDSPLAHTFSIVARDQNTGEMGVAVQSHWFSVGTSVTWGEAGVGVVATQSFVNQAFGPDGLKLLKEGKSAQEALDILINGDEGRDFRQVAILDSKGRVAAYTGKKCIQPAGHITGDNFSVQANLMSSDKVWPAMAKAFKNTEGPLAERMVAALEAAQSVGGDIRGKQSAALLVVKSKSTGKIWKDREIDLRVDDSDNPIKELKRLLKVYRAYEHMNNGDLAVEKGDTQKAMEEYSDAEKMFPNNLEMQYWHAVSLVNSGGFEEALPMFKNIFSQNENWRELTPRLIEPGLLTVTDKQLQKIMSLK